MSELQTEQEIKLARLRAEVAEDLAQQQADLKAVKIIEADRVYAAEFCLYDYYPLRPTGDNYYKSSSHYYGLKNGENTLLFLPKDGHNPPMVGILTDNGPLVHNFVYHDFSSDLATEWHFYGYYRKNEEETFLQNLAAKAKEVFEAVCQLLYAQTENEVNELLNRNEIDTVKTEAHDGAEG